VAWERRFQCGPGAVYAHDAQVEVFNSAQFPYGEIEVHSPLFTVPAGATVRALQEWRLWPWQGEGSLS
jgi:hypothetical protein